MKQITRDETSKQENDVFQNMLHINGNFFQLTLILSNSLKWKTLKMYRITTEETTRAFGMFVSELLYNRLYALWICCSFRPRCCFKYLAIHINSYFNIIFQCYKCIVVSIDNQQQFKSSRGNSTKPKLFMISSKYPGLGSLHRS